MQGCQRLAIAIIGTLLMLSVILYATNSMRMVSRSSEVEDNRMLKKFQNMAAEARGREDMCRKEVGEKDRVIRELEKRMIYAEDQLKEYKKSLVIKDISIMRAAGHTPKKRMMDRLREFD